MKRCFIVSLVLLLSFMLVITGCSNGEEAAPGESDTEANDFPESIVIASGPIGGPWYSACTKISEILMREIPGLNVSVIEGGAESNLELLEVGVDAQIAMTSSVALQQMTDGTGDKTLNNIGGIIPIVTSYIQTAVPEDSDIQSFNDLPGKNISAGKDGFASEVIFREIINAYDINYEKIEEEGGKIHLLNWGEYPDMIGDGHLDAVCLNGEVPHNIFMQIEVSTPLRLLSIDQEEKEKVLENMPALFTNVIPSGTYKGTEKDVELFGYSGILAANNELSDDFVLKIVEVIQDNKDEIVNELGFVDLLGWENATSGLNENVTRPAVWEIIQENN